MRSQYDPKRHSAASRRGRRNRRRLFNWDQSAFAAQLKRFGHLRKKATRAGRCGTYARRYACWADSHPAGYGRAFYRRLRCGLWECPSCRSQRARKIVEAYERRFSRLAQRLGPTGTPIFLEFKRRLATRASAGAVEDFAKLVHTFLTRLTRRLRLNSKGFGLLLFRTASWSGRRMTLITRALWLGPACQADVQALWAGVAGSADTLSVRSTDIDSGIAEVFTPEIFSPAEAASVTAIFHGGRRVRSMGALYGVPDEEGTGEEAASTSGHEPCCPHCGAELAAILYSRPLAEVVADGYEDLDQFRHRPQVWPRAGPIAA
jgi:hypothetical protein